MMTRKDYVSTAQLLSDFKSSISNDVVFEDLVEEFADLFSADNPRFDFEKFRIACNK